MADLEDLEAFVQACGEHEVVARVEPTRLIAPYARVSTRLIAPYARPSTSRNFSVPPPSGLLPRSTRRAVMLLVGLYLDHSIRDVLDID
eukprot:2150326-Rhodomonas_salina.1